MNCLYLFAFKHNSIIKNKVAAIIKDSNHFHRPYNADGETRTPKDKSTRTSSVRVYQFRHIRLLNFLEVRFMRFAKISLY
jgi:hypothetical protein